MPNTTTVIKRTEDLVVEAEVNPGGAIVALVVTNLVAGYPFNSTRVTLDDRQASQLGGALFPDTDN